MSPKTPDQLTMERLIKVEKALAAIRKEMFPPHRKKGEWWISDDIYYNLAGALHDMQNHKERYMDKVCEKTIERTLKRLGAVAQIFDKLRGRR